MSKDQFSLGTFGYTPRNYTKKKKKTSTVQPTPEPTLLVPSVIPDENTLNYDKTPLLYNNNTVTTHDLVPAQRPLKGATEQKPGINTPGTIYAHPGPTMLVPSVISNKYTLDYSNTPLLYNNKNVVTHHLLPDKNPGGGTISKDYPKSLNLGEYNYDDIYNEIYSSSSVSGATKVDVTALLNAYNQQKDAANAIAAQTYNSKRDQLLQSIKRAYEANELARQQQSQNFINDQANLEAANMANARNARVQAGNMGLSGSGVQQLAQLKNLLSQANAVSEVSSKNIAALEKLRSSLATTDEKAMAQLEDALNSYTTSVLGNNNKMAKNSADIVMDAETAYANALRSSQSSKSTYGMAANMVANTFNGATETLRYTLNYLSKMTTKELKQYAKNNGIDIKGIKSRNLKEYLGKQAAMAAQSRMDALNEEYSINPAMYNTAYSNIAALLDYYKNL